MSMLWLVTPHDEWSDEGLQVFSGIFATRRIASLRSFSRLLDVVEPGELTRAFAIVRLMGSENDFLVHSTLSKFISKSHRAQLMYIGTPSDNHMKILESQNVAYLGHGGDQLYLAQLIKSLMTLGMDPKSGAVATSTTLRLGDVEIDLTSGRLRILATDIKEQLSPKETRIVQVMAENINTQVSRDVLVGRVWAGLKVSSSTVDSHMSRLRRKLEQSFECTLETEYGCGWKLNIRA